MTSAWTIHWWLTIELLFSCLYFVVVVCFIFQISEGDLVYAELAEFDSANNDKTPRKPPSYEQTVYADVNVVPPEVRNPTSVDSTQPTYANVQTTGV